MTVAPGVTTVDRQHLDIDPAEGSDLRKHPLIPDRVPCMVDPDAVRLYNKLKIRIQSRFGVLIEEFVGRRKRVDPHISYRDRLPFVQPDCVLNIHPVRKDCLQMLSRKNKLCPGKGMRPDLPCIMVDMIQMVMGAQESVDPFQILCRNRRGALSLRIGACKVINAHGSFRGLDQKSHLPEPSKRDRACMIRMVPVHICVHLLFTPYS